MAGIHTEETLQPLNKTLLIKLFLKTQESLKFFFLTIQQTL